MSQTKEQAEHLFRMQCEVLGLDFDEEIAKQAAKEANKKHKES